MRKLWPLALLLAGVAIAGPVTMYPGNRKEFTDCSATGSAAQTLTADRSYLMRVTGEDTFVCFASSGSTCASGGEKFGAPFAAVVNITSDLKSVSCRSPNATGDVIFTQADVNVLRELPGTVPVLPAL